eukprot:363577-Chlamydomonas_euryale.AAC.2
MWWTKEGHDRGVAHLAFMFPGKVSDERTLPCAALNVRLLAAPAPALQSPHRAPTPSTPLPPFHRYALAAAPRRRPGHPARHPSPTGPRAQSKSVRRHVCASSSRALYLIPF